MELKIQRQLFCIPTSLVYIVMLIAIANETAALLNNLISSWKLIKYLPVDLTQTVLILELKKQKNAHI